MIMPAYTHYKWGTQRTALIDSLHWLGHDRFKLIVRLLKEDNDTEEIRQVYGVQLAMFAGISGAPVTAMLDRYLNRND
jgi:hypothetical protein